MSKKRDRLEIIKDILNAVNKKKDNVRATHIMYRANLSHQMLIEYSKELIKKGLIDEKKDKKGKKIYSLTDKGYNYIKDYSMIRGFVDSYGLE